MSHAATLRKISDSTHGERRRRAAAGAMVLHAAELAIEQAEGCAFAHQRAAMEVEALPASAETSILKRVLLVLEEAGEAMPCRLTAALVQYGYELESTRRLPEADAVLHLARSVSPPDPELALHAGRVARKLGDHDRALELYREARSLDGGSGAVARLAAIGEAAVSTDPGAALARAIRRAVRDGDAEAAAVGLEERARVRRSAGRRRAAARDLCTAAARFPDPVDRARVAHELADLTLAAGDAMAAREALLAALSLGDALQRDHARARLHTLCRELGDQVGMRRWRPPRRPSLVSLSTAMRIPGDASAAPMLLRWRAALERQATPA